MSFPLLSQAWVVGYDAAKRTLFIRLPSTQGTGIPVSVGYHGPADDLRVDQKPLPRIGTMGLVAFPYGDARNGIWLQSIYAAGNSATMPNSQGRLRTEWTGEVEYMSDAGDYYHRFPDGSYFSLGSSTEPPTITRRVVSQDQTYQDVDAPDSERRSGDVAVKPFFFRHSSGSTIQVDTDGKTTFTLPDGGQMIFGSDGAPDGLVLVSKMVEAFNAHSHPSNGATPSVKLSASDIRSGVVGVSK